MLGFVFVLIVVCYLLVFGCLFGGLLVILLGYVVVVVSWLGCCFSGCGVAE